MARAQQRREKLVATPVEGWKGDRIRLVPLENDRHFENTYRWINNPDLTRYINGDDLPATRLRQMEWFEEVQRDSATGKQIVFAIELLDGTHIGDSGFYRLDQANGWASTGTFIGGAHHGKGYGTEACKLRAWYAFNVLGLRILESGYVEGNLGSHKMQEKSGYLEAVRTPQRFWAAGKYRDSVRTVLTRDRWEKLSGGKPVW